MKSDSKPNFGVLLPTREAVISGRSDPSVLFRLAERAEVLGFHSVWVGDSLTARPRIDALTTLAAVGARTRRVRLGTAIFLAALRNPIMLAYQLASLDWITGGRIDLGVGYGRPKEPAAEHEFKILGLDPSARMKMSEELIQVMRRLWFEKDVSYAGKFTSFEHVTLEPKPVQPKGVPIWIASNNASELWISNDNEPVNTFKRAWVSTGTSAPLTWNAESNQKSPWLALEQGKKYYVEILRRRRPGPIRRRSPRCRIRHRRHRRRIPCRTRFRSRRRRRQPRPRRR